MHDNMIFVCSRTAIYFIQRLICSEFINKLYFPAVYIQKQL